MNDLNVLFNCVTNNEKEINVILKEMFNYIKGKQKNDICLISNNPNGKSTFEFIVSQVIPGFKVKSSNEELKDYLNIVIEHDIKISDYVSDYESFKKSCVKDLRQYLGIKY